MRIAHFLARQAKRIIQTLAPPYECQNARVNPLRWQSEEMEPRITPTTVTVAALANGTEGGGNGAVRFTRDGDTSSSLFISVSLGGTAISADYTFGAMTTFPANESTFDISINVWDDSAVEPTETVEVGVATGEGYTAGTGIATVYIFDNEDPTIYSTSYDWNGVAEVAVTVTQAPDGNYLWTYHVTNESFANGIANFAVPVEDAAMVSGLGSSPGWGGSVGIPSNSCLVTWQAGTAATIGIGSSADFTFTTVPAGIALTNGLVDDSNGLDLVASPAGLLAAPVPQGPQVTPMPALLVATAFDEEQITHGFTSIRQAIGIVNRWAADAAQNNLPAPPTVEIRFSSSIANTTITLLDYEELPTIDASVFINGTGRNITIRRDPSAVPLPLPPLPDFRLMQVSPTGNATIAWLTLWGGAGLGNGGAIYNAGDLTLLHCVLWDNYAPQGGAIYSDGNTLTLDGCTVTANSASDGGGIYVASGSVLIQDTWITDNHAHSGDNVGNGGGVYISGGVSHVVIEDTDISYNTANRSGAGGGIYIEGASGSSNLIVEIRNVTITHNHAGFAGGGIATSDTGNLTLILDDGTLIASNEAFDPDVFSYGGGVYFGTGVLYTYDTTITLNIAESGGGLYWEIGTTWLSQNGAHFWLNYPDNVATGP